jgi:ankyrin repeat protein/predicted DNA-binding WGR domain protein
MTNLIDDDAIEYKQMCSVNGGVSSTTKKRVAHGGSTYSTSTSSYSEATSYDMDRALDFIDHYIETTKDTVNQAIVEMEKHKDTHIGYSPIHFAVIKSNAQLIKYLVEEAHADINAADPLGRTPIHFAMNASKDNTELLSMVKYLLRNGADVTKQDNLKRTPMFYLFTSTGYNRNANGHREPIEQLTDMMTVDNVDCTVKDVYGRTALHYSAIMGNTICSMYLIQRGLDINEKDVDGNTPLGLSLMASHVDFTVTLINKGGDVKNTVTILHDLHHGFNRFDADDKDKTDPERVSFFRLALSKSFFGLAYLLMDIGVDLTSAVEDAMVTSQFGVCLTLIRKAPREAIKDMNSQGQNLFHLVCSREDTTEYRKYALNIAMLLFARGVDINACDARNRTPLHYATERRNNVLVVFLKDHGANPNVREIETLRVPLHFVYDDSTLVSSLIATSPSYGAFNKEKNPHLKVVAANLDSVDNLGRTPLHLAAKALNSSVISSLRSAGADPNIQEQSTLYTPVHYTCFTRIEDHASALRSMFRYSYKSKLNTDIKDSTGRAAINYACENANKALIKILIDEGADPNVVEPSTQKTPLHRLADQVASYETFQTLLASKKKINCDVKDETGRTPLHILFQYMYKDLFATHNVVLPIQYICSAGANVNEKDNLNKAPIHYVTSHNMFGAFEHSSMIRLLGRYKADINLEDDAGKTPLYYACMLQDKKVENCLLELGAKDSNDVRKSAMQALEAFKTNVLKLQEPEEITKERSKLDITADARQRREELENLRKDKEEEEVIDIDSEANMPSATVVHSKAGDGTYNALLQKTSIEYGASGWNNFYKLQILVNPLQPELFVLFTRWGRVGDRDSQYQRTPYAKEDEVITEFKKIFKSKTKNDWNDREKFEKHPGKYSLVHLTNSNVRDILHPIDWKNQQEPKLKDKKLQKIVKKFCDVDLLKRYTRQTTGLSESGLGELRRDALTKGFDILKEILEKIEVLNKGVVDDSPIEQDQTMTENEAVESATTVAEVVVPTIRMRELNPTERRIQFDELTELSNKFYTLIPHGEFARSPIRPITEEKTVREKMQMLTDLIDLQIATRIILAAQHRTKEISPVDYCYYALNSHMIRVGQTDPDLDIIKRYIALTNSHAKLKGAYRVVRHEEVERFKPWEKNSNRMLLWHGSAVSNFLSILSSGLKIAPPQAPVSGYMVFLLFLDTNNYSLEEEFTLVMCL